jgi:hypothetical protein
MASRRESDVPCRSRPAGSTAAGRPGRNCRREWTWPQQMGLPSDEPTVDVHVAERKGVGHHGRADRDQVPEVRKQLGAEHADAPLLVDAPGFFIPKAFGEHNEAFFSTPPRATWETTHGLWQWMSNGLSTLQQFHQRDK